MPKTNRIGNTKRYVRNNVQKLPSIAKGATTRAIKKGFNSVVDEEQFSGDFLKNSVIKMGETLGLPQEMWNKINAMDSSKLEKYYRTNKFSFELYFSYGSAELMDEELGYFEFDESKLQDVQEFINQYERLFGTL